MLQQSVVVLYVMMYTRVCGFVYCSSRHGRYFLSLWEMQGLICFLWNNCYVEKVVADSTVPL
jgi:hypothetical protein